MKHVQASNKVALDSESKVADVSNVKLYILTEKPREFGYSIREFEYSK